MIAKMVNPNHSMTIKLGKKAAPPMIEPNTRVMSIAKSETKLLIYYNFQFTHERTNPIKTIGIMAIWSI